MAAQDVVNAANAGVPNNTLKPQNCHEAALGWTLLGKYASLRGVDPMSQGVAKAWFTLRNIALRYGGANPKQLTGQWVGQHIYHRGIVRIRPPFSGATFALGDVIFMGNPQAPHHSMVIVQINGSRAHARGFNNAGAFGGPYMAWDPAVREITDLQRWNGDDEFMGNNGAGPLHAISYNAICNSIPDTMNF